MKTVMLEDIADIVMGQSPAGEFYNVQGEGKPLITGAGQFGLRVPNPLQFSRTGTKLSMIGDLLVCIRATIGDLNWSDREYYIGRGIAALRPSNRVCPGYIWHYINTCKSYLESRASGSTFKQIKRSDLAQLEIPLPPLPEQQRIAAILDAAEALREKRRQAIAKLDTLVQAVFVEMFGDPVENPKHWSLIRFGEAGTLDRGVSKHRPRNAPELLGGPYPLIQTGEVANSGGYITSYVATYSESGLRQSKMWSAGTLCITIAANIAKTGILTFDACFPDSVVGFTPGINATTEYIQHWLSFLQQELETQAPQVAQKNINLAILRNLNLPLPPKSLQQQFTDFVNSVNRVKTSQTVSLTHLDTLFASLQKRAFRGEL